MLADPRRCAFAILLRRSAPRLPCQWSNAASSAAPCCSARPDGAPYRTDQIGTLEYATREVGLDLYALQLQRLTDQAAAERRTSETLRAQLHSRWRWRSATSRMIRSC